MFRRGTWKGRDLDVTANTRTSERGMALLVTVLITGLMAALGLGLVVSTSLDALVAGHYQRRQQGVLAAEAALARALLDVANAADWSPMLRGTRRSSFTDGFPGGVRDLGDGRQIDLDHMTWEANCGRPAPCGEADLDAVSADRPWGSNNPRWTLYAWGPLARLAGAAPVPRLYVVVWIADDPAERDGDPYADGDPATSPGAGRVALRATARGGRGLAQTVEAIVAREAPGDGVPGLRIVAWREVRGH